MAKFKAYDYWQRVFLPVSLEDQLRPEALEFAIHTCRRATIEASTCHDLRHMAINTWRLQGHDYFRIMAAIEYKTLAGCRQYNPVSEENLKPWQMEVDHDSPLSGYQASSICRPTAVP
ncbi:MAG: hypothetical protein WBV23_14265 [Desulfobaccales bacterium]